MGKKTRSSKHNIIDHNMKTVISVEHLSKSYRLGQIGTGTFAYDLNVWWARLRGKPNPYQRIGETDHGNRVGEEVWALKDVSFQVQQGEVLGIIGRNGAGKSTLLKILSRVTAPTSGEIKVKGRVASLLEVGTGFHPDLTGRENVYLNGAILGMTRAEVERKFDEIVDFAGVEKFIDTPVKRYSSGMYVRLAFAVASHLESEILVVDEVLAVGDAEFQQRCFRKMQEVSRGGRTILFVSHNMAALRQICEKGLLLESGKISTTGPVNEVVDEYLVHVFAPANEALAVETKCFVVQSVGISSIAGTAVIKTFDPVEIRINFMTKQDIADPGLYVGILTMDGQRILGIDFKDMATIDPIREGQTVDLGFVIDELPLLPGQYQIEVHLKDLAHSIFEVLPTRFNFQIVETPIYGGRRLDHWFGIVGLRARPLEARY